MRAHARPSCTLSRPRIGHLAQHCNHTQFFHERGVEGYFVQAIEDLPRGSRRAESLARIDLHEYRVLRVALSHERGNGRVSCKTAIPIRLSINFDCLEQRR